MPTACSLRTTVLVALMLAAVAGFAVTLAIAGAAESPAPRPTLDRSAARRMPIAEVQKRLQAGEKVLIVDSRASIAGPMIKDAVHVPNARLAEWAGDRPRDALIITYCV